MPREIEVPGLEEHLNDLKERAMQLGPSDPIIEGPLAREYRRQKSLTLQDIDKSLTRLLLDVQAVAVHDGEQEIEKWADGVKKSAKAGMPSVEAEDASRRIVREVGEAAVRDMHRRMGTIPGFTEKGAEIPAVVGLTLEERGILDNFAEVYGKLRSLPDFDHAAEGELAAALHVFQDHVAMRVARRANPGFWRAAR